VVLVTHHPLKSDADTYRGHSSLMNNTHTMLVAHRDAGDNLIMLSVPRHKGPRAAPVGLRLIIKATDITDPDGNPIAASVVVPVGQVRLAVDHLSARQNAILRFLLDLDDDGGATITEITDEISRAYKVTAGRVRTDINVLVKRQLITVGKQRQPRRITDAGRAVIKSDQVDQADQVDLFDPFEVNPNLDQPLPTPSPTGGASYDPSQQDAADDEPNRLDRTRSQPDRDQVDQATELIT